MSFLKISDPAKRDAMVKEYLELKKNIRDNLLSERTGELELQTDLSKFYRPITETQKATANEITEGLKPIREGIEKLPQAIQPIKDDWEEEEEKEEDEEKKKKEEKKKQLLGERAYSYLNRPNPDEKFGVREEGDHHWIGDKHVIIHDNDIYTKEDGELFLGTDGLWELITSTEPKKIYEDQDLANYGYLMIKTNALHRGNNPKNSYPKANKSDIWNYILKPFWDNRKKYSVYEGEGVVVIPSDPNELLERLDLLLASQDAGHTGVGNELVSICDELKRQGVLDTKTYKKLNSIIKK